MISHAPKATTFVYSSDSYGQFVSRVIGDLYSYQIKIYTDIFFPEKTNDFRKDMVRLIITIRDQSDDWKFASENETKQATLYTAVWKLIIKIVIEADGYFQEFDRISEQLKDLWRHECNNGKMTEEECLKLCGHRKRERDHDESLSKICTCSIIGSLKVIPNAHGSSSVSRAFMVVVLPCGFDADARVLRSEV